MNNLQRHNDGRHGEKNVQRIFGPYARLVDARSSWVIERDCGLGGGGRFRNTQFLGEGATVEAAIEDARARQQATK